ncbi:serine/threonine-protein kinase HSL1 [Arachis ipaensis]|uniref:serine/threonine-protein kinase HSL1 n=1 Tax=Arachis ipaensis TaxID=130454 RepID=UPI0007AF555B|nr:serine/threonine-protein kinase HSL1 [Arachis ipaensis]QHO11078.1 Light-sensor Protein kinase [Arachis hypogaea]QHO11079.1 Light-sensor Protein kinase [Arachis hypogaea]
MEQFRHIGETLGSLKALMVLRDEIQINQRQCCLILEMFSLAFETIAEEIRQNLKLEERSSKWKPLELPLRELCRVFKEAELYIRQCLDSKEWWGKAITMSNNSDCVEFHIHNLLCCFPAVIEAIENAGEACCLDQTEKEKKKVMVSRKYDMEWNDSKLFQWRFGKQYLVSREIISQLENAWKEDRWRLIESLKEKKTTSKKNEQRLAEILLKKLVNGSDSKTNQDLWPIHVLVGAKDYQVRRRLGKGKEYKEVTWLGQSFALRYFNGEKQAYEGEISKLLCLSHPNILQYLCGFYDEEKKEFNLVMELMSKDLWTYMKENSGPRRQILFSIPVVVDLMLQIARGMEYLHSKKIYHGDLNPYGVLLKARNSQEGYFHAKVSGFGLPSLRNRDPAQNPEDLNPSIWYAPEVLHEIEKGGKVSTSCKYSEKADAYSFGMICFELLTGKVPFEDNHLQGERTTQNIKAGERPLFPGRSPKYLVSLIKKCWQTDPSQRPTFSSICRILRYTKKFLSTSTEYYIINPELNNLELQSPPVDCCDIETTFLKNLPEEMAPHVSAVSQIPYQIYAYKVVEKGKISLLNSRDKGSETELPKEDSPQGSDEFSFAFEDDQVSAAEPFQFITSPKSVHGGETPSFFSEAPAKKTVRIKSPVRKLDKLKKDQGAKSMPASRITLKASKAYLASPAASPLHPALRKKPTQVSETERNTSKNNKAVTTTPSTPIRRRKCEGQHVPEFMGSPRVKPRDQSPLMANKLKKTPLTMTPGRMITRTSDAHLILQKRLLMGSSTSKGGRWDHGTEHRTSLSSLALSPLSPYVMRRRRSTATAATSCGHASDSESTCSKHKRESISPFAMSPLSPYASRTTACGHVSD